MLNKPITFITLASEDYLDYLRGFLTSANKFYPDISIYVILVNVSYHIAKEIRDLHAKCKVIIERIKFPSEKYKRCYCAGRRAELFNIIRKERKDHILVWIDADSIFKKRNLNLINILTKYDVGMRKKYEKTNKIGSGIICINTSKIASRFIKKYAKYSRKRFKLLDWFNDQKMLEKTFNKLKSKLNFTLIEYPFCDTSFSDEGIIWIGKGSSRIREKFIEELTDLKTAKIQNSIKANQVGIVTNYIKLKVKILDRIKKIILKSAIRNYMNYQLSQKNILKLIELLKIIIPNIILQFLNEKIFNSIFL